MKLKFSIIIAGLMILHAWDAAGLSKECADVIACKKTVHEMCMSSCDGVDSGQTHSKDNREQKKDNSKESSSEESDSDSSEDDVPAKPLQGRIFQKMHSLVSCLHDNADKLMSECDIDMVQESTVLVARRKREADIMAILAGKGTRNCHKLCMLNGVAECGSNITDEQKQTCKTEVCDCASEKAHDIARQHCGFDTPSSMFRMLTRQGLKSICRDGFKKERRAKQGQRAQDRRDRDIRRQKAEKLLESYSEAARNRSSNQGRNRGQGSNGNGGNQGGNGNGGNQGDNGNGGNQGGNGNGGNQGGNGNGGNQGGNGNGGNQGGNGNGENQGGNGNGGNQGGNGNGGNQGGNSDGGNQGGNSDGGNQGGNSDGGNQGGNGNGGNQGGNSDGGNQGGNGNGGNQGGNGNGGNQGNGLSRGRHRGGRHRAQGSGSPHQEPGPGRGNKKSDSHNQSATKSNSNEKSEKSREKHG